MLIDSFHNEMFFLLDNLFLKNPIYLYSSLLFKEDDIYIDISSALRV